MIIHREVDCFSASKPETLASPEVNLRRCARIRELLIGESFVANSRAAQSPVAVCTSLASALIASHTCSTDREQ